MKSILSILFLGIMVACNAQTNKIERIDVAKQLEMSANDDVIVIDVRTPGEVAEGYIKGTSKFIDYNGANFNAEIEALDKSKTYVVYCRSGNRSTKALNIMSDLGFTKLYELKGGISSVNDPALLQK